jgi:hypothetical protein
MHGKVTKTNSRNSAFAVRLWRRTAKVPIIAVRFLGKRTANSPVCRAFSGRRTANKGCLSCVFQGGARQKTPVCRAFCSRRTTKVVPRRLAPVPLVAFVCRASRKKRTAKIAYRALSDAAHGKGASPCKILPCALCRAPRQKTHGKGFAVRFKAFAVRSGRTAKALFPVV